MTTGCGRTGNWFAYQHEDVAPDIMTMAKGLGGGVAIGAFTATAEVAKSLIPGMHASTFGGNALACTAALAVFRLIDENDLLARGAELGAHARDLLRDRIGGLDVVTDIRGRGMMLGVQLTVSGADVVNTCRERGLLINCTHDTVLRIYPALNIARDDLDRGLGILADVLAERQPTA